MISILIPAYREAERIGGTLVAVCRAAAEMDEPVEILVIDDGSDDGTAEAAQAFRCSGVQVIRLERNQGKGAALTRGLAEVRGEWIVMLDADLGATAGEFPCLLAPVRDGAADMTIALFPSPLPPDPGSPHAGRGGLGVALRVARWGVARLTGGVLAAPLSGQRAFAAAHRGLLTPLEPGFGLEVGLDVNALRAGLRVLEVPTTMAHRLTGRNWAGFWHRGRQLLHIARALARRAARRGKQNHKATETRRRWEHER